VRRDDEGWYKNLRLHYYLTAGRDYLRERDRQKLNSMLEAGGGAAFKPDINQTLLGAKIAALEILGVRKLFDDPEREFRATDDDLIKMAEYALSQRQELKTILGITIHSPKKNKDGETKLPTIGIAKQLLALLGLKLERQRRDGGGVRLWVYQVSGWDDGREAIFEQWVTRDRELAQQKEASQQHNNNMSTPSSCEVTEKASHSTDSAPQQETPLPRSVTSQQGANNTLCCRAVTDTDPKPSLGRHVTAAQSNSFSTVSCDVTTTERQPTSQPSKLLTEYLIGEVVWSWHYNAKRWFKAEVIKAAHHLKDFLRVVGIGDDSKLANHLLTENEWIQPFVPSGGVPSGGLA
jgi:hypothetical protein